MKAKVPEMITLETHNERIEYLDMLCLMVLHRVFGFGPARLRRYYDAIGDMDAYYKRYNSNQEPIFGKKSKNGMTRMNLWKLKKDLLEIGVDYDAMVDDEKSGGKDE